MAEIETAEDLIYALLGILFLIIFFFYNVREIWRTHFASDRCRESFCSKKAQKDSKYCHSCQNEKNRRKKYNNRKSLSKPRNITKKEKTIKLEAIKEDKIKPKLKPKPIEKKIEPKSDMIIQNKIKPEIKKNDEQTIIDKPKPIQKPQPDFNIASVLKDLRNEEAILQLKTNEHPLFHCNQYSFLYPPLLQKNLASMKLGMAMVVS